MTRTGQCAFPDQENLKERIGDLAPTEISNSQSVTSAFQRSMLQSSETSTPGLTCSFLNLALRARFQLMAILQVWRFVNRLVRILLLDVVMNAFGYIADAAAQQVGECH